MPAVTYWRESDADNVTQEIVHEGEGEIKIRRFFYGKSQLGARFHVWELPPGTVEGSHTHKGEDALEEIYYILQGRGLMQIEGEAVEVSPGDAVLVPPGVDHDLRSLGPEPLRLVLLFGPPAGEAASGEDGDEGDRADEVRAAGGAAAPGGGESDSLGQ